MQILEAKNKRDYNQWLSIWSNWKGKEIYAHPDYLSLYGEWSEAFCAVYSKGEQMILFPFCLRDIPHDLSESKYYDIITPYGYSDIYLLGTGDFDFLKKEFYFQFQKWAILHNVVSEFIRFDLFSQCIDNFSGEIIHNNNNVVCELTKGRVQIWKEFKPKVRRNVRKALSYDLTIEFDSEGDKLDSFLRLYYGTMKRRNAQEKYYLKREYFESIHKTLKGSFMYFFVNHGGIDVSAELVLISDDKIYFFLGGTDEDAFFMRPNDLLKNEIIKWGINHEKKYYVLGGGYRPNDSIFSFKKDFAPTGSMPYYVGTKIYDQKVYDRLMDSKNKRVKSGVNHDEELEFFPLYREGMNDHFI